MRIFTTPRFQTAFDRVVEPLTLPGRVSSGAVPELTTVDQLVRGTAVIGRFIASPGLLGVKVRPTGRPVRVTAHFRYDSMSLDWWEERITTPGPVRGAGAPRLLLVRSQGKTRGAALLVRPAADFRRAATGVVCFDLQPEELTAEGLFVFEMDSIDKDRPEWAPAVPSGSVGIMMEAIEFAEVQGDREIGLVSTGTLPLDPDSGTLTLRAGYFVANPTGQDEPRRWIAGATLVEPLVPGPRTKVAPVVEPVESRPSTSGGIKRKVNRRIKRAARWVVPVAAAPAARRVSRRAAALERRVLRAARRRMRGRSAPWMSDAPPAPAPPTGPPPNPLADVMFDLVSRKLVRVELAGIEPGPTPGVQVRARAGAEIEIVTDGPLRTPALIRLSIDPSVLRELPGVDDKTVRWELVVQSES
ncbi:hypothetical protein EV644_102298 [Kribbella orskensis]|uniref:Uncharacterized protein n=1 Tax=Kribbella orskensis TaxID=2512216 RepID=A0ABY2BRP1_9ACTN|nr:MULTISPECIES: hypothetical protein [Kribbella]TCN43066.1 hypothetical protein EV642_102439 [Kribbella sp. VKM Ac-2500]TCO29578.1 hypothetical protein EV644_102298 [Kribbella orskensis]